MSASELRIGNWVYEDDGQGMLPNRISPNKLIAILYGDKGFSYIPITEEWLKRFGFTKGKIFFWCPKKDYISAYFDSVGELAININNGDAYACTVEYVHQLQNLYFALTKEELITTEPLIQNPKI